MTMLAKIPITLRNYKGLITEPSQTDVLCGKDTTLARHPGNRLFREKIQAELPRYLEARSKQDKMKITKSIVQFVTVKQASRFLKQKSSGVWVEVDAQACRDKVSHALRFAARQQKKSSDESSSQGSIAEASDSVPIPPPPMPSRQEIDRTTTNVEELFAAFEQPLAGSIHMDDDMLDHSPTKAPRRGSGHFLLSFLSSLDYNEEEMAKQANHTAAALVHSSFSFDLELDLDSTNMELEHEHSAVTQWASCWWW